jgi:hypothetical protein
VKRSLVLLLLAVLLLMLWGWFNIWRSPAAWTPARPCAADSTILSMSEYGNLAATHARPFVLVGDSLVVFGAEHTRDPDDPQIEAIRRRWKRLQPTVALVEGRLDFFIPYAMDPVQKLGESGYVASLAKSDEARLFTWELPESELVVGLLQRHPPVRVALLRVLSPWFSNVRFGQAADPEAVVSGSLHRAQAPGLTGVPSSVAQIDSIWRHDFPDDVDWRQTSDQFGLPGYLQSIADDANLLRNAHLLCIIRELRARHERIFVVCGSSHAVCLAQALQAEAAPVQDAASVVPQTHGSDL